MSSIIWFLLSLVPRLYTSLMDPSMTSSKAAIGSWLPTLPLSPFNVYLHCFLGAVLSLVTLSLSAALAPPEVEQV